MYIPSLFCRSGGIHSPHKPNEKQQTNEKRRNRSLRLFPLSLAIGSMARASLKRSIKIVQNRRSYTNYKIVGMSMFQCVTVAVWARFQRVYNSRFSLWIDHSSFKPWAESIFRFISFYFHFIWFFESKRDFECDNNLIRSLISFLKQFWKFCQVIENNKKNSWTTDTHQQLKEEIRTILNLISFYGELKSIINKHDVNRRKELQ